MNKKRKWNRFLGTKAAGQYSQYQPAESDFNQSYF